MHRKWIVIAAVLGLTGVASGAFGAHALKARISPEKLASFEVGVRYQMYHALALLAVAWVISIRPSWAAKAAGVCMTIGVVMFSGSIYGLSLTELRWLGPVTPIGGMLMMIGWVMLAMAGGSVGNKGMPSATSGDLHEREVG